MRRLRSAQTSVFSQSMLSARRKLKTINTQGAHTCKTSDLTGQMPRLILVFTQHNSAHSFLLGLFFLNLVNYFSTVIVATQCNCFTIRLLEFGCFTKTTPIVSIYYGKYVKCMSYVNKNMHKLFQGKYLC